MKTGVSFNLCLAVITISCFFRLFSSVLLNTSVIPDEYYQHYEPAYQMIYGTSIRTWEWNPEYRIRSYVPLLPTVGLYALVKSMDGYCTHHACLFIDSMDKLFDFEAFLVTKGPRILQSMLCIVSDMCFYLTMNLWCSSYLETSKDERIIAYVPFITLLIHITSWSGISLHCRTIANSTEMCLLLIILYLLELNVSVNSKSNGSDKCKGKLMKAKISVSLILCFCCIAMSIYMRPTAVILLCPLWIRYCFTVEHKARFVVYYSNNSDKNPMQLGLWSTIYRVNMDTLQFNRKVIIPPWNFIYFNVIKGVASVFGVHPWHWYLTQGVPMLLGVYTPLLCLYGIYGDLLEVPGQHWTQNMSNMHAALVHHKYTIVNAVKICVADRLLHFIVLSFGYMGVMSMLPHKEFRFLLPCIPGICILLGFCMIKLYKYSQCIGNTGGYLYIGCVILLFNVTFGLYMILYHQSGGENGFAVLRDKFKSVYSNQGRNKLRMVAWNMSELPSNHDPIEVVALGPCYSFPGYAFLHTTESVRTRLQLHMPECYPPDDLNRLQSPSQYLVENGAAAYINQYILSRNELNSNYCSSKSEESCFVPSSAAAHFLISYDGYITVNKKICSDSQNLYAHTNISKAKATVNGTTTILDDVNGYLQSYSNELITKHHAHWRYDYDDHIRKYRVVILQ